MERVAILKDGRKVGDCDSAASGRDEIQVRMVGHGLSTARIAREPATAATQPVLSMRALGSGTRLVLLVAALGMTFVIIAGSIDLSVGAIVVLAALATTWSVPTLGGAAGLSVGVACGLLNGIVMAKGKVPSFIVTLGAMVVCRGIVLFFTRGVPGSALIALGLVTVTLVILNLTVFDREVRAIGGVGSIQGTILDALIITTPSNGMNSIGLDPYFQNIVKGVVLVLSVFVAIDRNKIGIIK